MKVRKLKLKTKCRRIHFPASSYPLCRAMCVQLMVQALCGDQSLQRERVQEFRRLVSARRNTRFRRVPEYNKVSPATLAERSRRCTLVHKVPARLVMPKCPSKKGK